MQKLKKQKQTPKVNRLKKQSTTLLKHERRVFKF